MQIHIKIPINYTQMFFLKGVPFESSDFMYLRGRGIRVGNNLSSSEDPQQRPYVEFNSLPEEAERIIAGICLLVGQFPEERVWICMPLSEIQGMWLRGIEGINEWMFSRGASVLQEEPVPLQKDTVYIKFVARPEKIKECVKHLLEELRVK